jgi:tetratricopeptide (TPR) repeat protein
VSLSCQNSDINCDFQLIADRNHWIHIIHTAADKLNMKHILVIIILLTANYDDPERIANLEAQAISDQSDWLGRIELAEIFLEQGNYISADKYLSEIEIMPGDSITDSAQSKAIFLRGLYYDLQDNIPEAMQKYIEATEIDTANARAWRRLGYLHEVFTDGEKMVDCFRHALAFTDDSAGVYYDLAVGYDYMDSLNLAVESYRNSLAINDALPEAYLNLGVDLGYLGYVDSSLYYFEKAAAAGMDEPELYYNIGVMKFEAGQVESALANFLKVLGIDPDYSPAQLQLGNVYEAVGDSGMARTYYEQFINTASLLYLDDINAVKEKLTKYK